MPPHITGVIPTGAAQPRSGGICFSTQDDGPSQDQTQERP
jgi:hypothetical protein